MKKFALFILAFTSVNAFAQSYTSKQYKDDFSYFWNTIDSNYSYFGKKQLDWNSLKKIYSRQVDTVTSRNSFVSILENVMYELYDHHCSLRTNTKFSRRLVPGYSNFRRILRTPRRSPTISRFSIRGLSADTSCRRASRPG